MERDRKKQMCKDEAKCLAKQAEAKLCQCMYGHGPGHVDVGQHETRDETDRTHKKMHAGMKQARPSCDSTQNWALIKSTSGD